MADSTRRIEMLEVNRKRVREHDGFLAGTKVMLRVKVNDDIDDDATDDETQRFEYINGKVVRVQYDQTVYTWSDKIPVVDEFNHLKLVLKSDLKLKQDKRKREEGPICCVCRTARPTLSFVHGDTAHLAICETCAYEGNMFMRVRRRNLQCPLCTLDVEKMVKQYST